MLKFSNKIKSPSLDDRIKAVLIQKIEEMLSEMRIQGKDLSHIKLKKFQKTHHIECSCEKCKNAKLKNDPRLRGILEKGFKIFVEGDI